MSLPPIVHHPDYVAADVPDDHRFPMRKFGALARRLEAIGLAPEGFVQPAPIAPARLAAVHDPAYVEAVLTANVDPARARRIGFAMTPAIARRAQLATAGTLLAARLALADGIACNTAGGSHHADREGGAGFSVFNDVAVAARALLDEGRVERVMVIDCDVHQGDGTARIFADEPRVFTLSLHCGANFPLVKAQSDLDVDVPVGTGDADYLALLKAALVMAFRRFSPDLVFYNAGVDVHVADKLGRLALTDAGIAARDATVIERVRSAGVPLAGILGGGYDPDVEALAERHAHLHRAAAISAARPARFCSYPVQ